MSSENEFVIIGVDPGATTGLFLVVCTELEWRTEPVQVAAEQVPQTLHTLLSHWVPRVGPESVHIAMERFIITPRTGQLTQQTDALEVTGMVKAVASLSGLGGTVDVRQYVKGNLGFASDDALRRSGWWPKGMRHAADAARQAFALLKAIDHPVWCRVSEGAMMEFDADERMKR